MSKRPRYGFTRKKNDVSSAPIVLAFGLDERTVANCQLIAGQHAQQVQQEKVCQGNLVAHQIQADDGNKRFANGCVLHFTPASLADPVCCFGQNCT